MAKSLVRDLLGDYRYAARMLQRSPRFATLAIAIMALGIGANTAMFSVINAVLLKPLPYPGADRIVALHTVMMPAGERNPLVTGPNFQDWRDRGSSFEAMATYRGGDYPVAPGDTAEYARAAIVDAQFFRVFGVEPILGRTFSPEEARPGSGGAAIISHSYWQSRFGGDRNVLSRTVRVGNDRRPVVGVLPAGFGFPRDTELWFPQTSFASSRTSHRYFAVGRLNPGVSLEQARSELSGIAAALEQQYPESNDGRGAGAVPLQETLVGNVRFTLYLLWGVVGIVLLIACANTATLLLGKATARAREIAVRTAVGATRFRIVRQLITESLLLSLVAGGLGILLASWGTRLLVAVSPADVVRDANPAIDSGVLAFTLVVSVATSLLFGLVPALQAARVDLMDVMKRGANASSGGRTRRTHDTLVVAEVTLAVILLAGAGLLVKTLLALQDVQLGFQPANVLVMKATGVQSRSENAAFFTGVMSRIRSLPGVAGVGATSIPPGDLTLSGDGYYFIDRVPERRDRTKEPTALFNVIAPGTFGALGIPLRSGRDFNEADTATSPLVAIVNEALVRQSLAGQDPIGRTIFCNFDRKDGMRIVGVVGDVRQRSPGVEPMPECYMPFTQHSYNGNTLNVVIRTAAEPLSLAGSVRRVAAEVSPQVPVSFTTMEATISRRVEQPKFRAMLFAVFAILAVCLATAGVYGIMAYAVTQRSREIGLRMALGASHSAVLRMVLRQGVILGMVGVLIGVAGAAAATRLLESVLFEVHRMDAEVYLGVMFLVLLVTLLAAFVPARRAAAVDPVQVLKAE